MMFFVLFNDLLTYVDFLRTYSTFLFRLETALVVDQPTEFCERNLFRSLAWTAESHQLLQAVYVPLFRAVFGVI
jgi:hypothetical protein